MIKNSGTGKFGNTFDSNLLQSPLTVGKPAQEKGPQVLNNPVAKPADPLGICPK